jgi:hypothetical protein
LVVSEIMYHATNPTPAEQAVAAALSPPQTWDDDDFDYLELRNVGATPVDLTGFQFVAGFDFAFPSGTILAPGANIIVVANLTAFTTRYAAGKPVAGAWDPNDKLGNGGDTLTLQYGLITTPPVFSFAFDDDAALNWPVTPDGQGPSLVRISPENTALDPNLGINWRASAAIGGSPGGDDRVSFPTWLGGGSTGDSDNDGLTALAEYALGGNLNADSSSRIPTAQFQDFTVSGVPGTYITLTFSRVNAHEDVQQTVEFSTNLTAWPISGVQVGSIDNGDGTRTEIWRSSQPVSASSRIFGRVRFVRPGP